MRKLRLLKLTRPRSPGLSLAEPDAAPAPPEPSMQALNHWATLPCASPPVFSDALCLWGGCAVTVQGKGMKWLPTEPSVWRGDTWCIQPELNKCSSQSRSCSRISQGRWRQNHSRRSGALWGPISTTPHGFPQGTPSILCCQGRGWFGGGGPKLPSSWVQCEQNCVLNLGFADTRV